MSALLSTLMILFFPPSPEDRLWFDCAVRIQLPEYPPVARQARLTGTAVATVTISSDSAVRIRLEGVPPILKRAVEASLRKSEFSDSCKDTTFSIRYTFRVEGEQAERPKTSIIFQPPNEFIVVSPPSVPMP